MTSVFKGWRGRTAVAMAFVAGAAGVQAVEPGQVPPEVQLVSAAGPKALSQLKGQVVYVDFWASWCGPCRQSFPWMNEMQQKYGAQGLQIVGVNLDAKRSDADQFLSQVPARFALAFDAKGDTAKAFEVKGMPTSVLIGADGRVIRVHQGFRADERKELEDQLAAALAAARK